MWFKSWKLFYNRSWVIGVRDVPGGAFSNPVGRGGLLLVFLMASGLGCLRTHLNVEEHGVRMGHSLVFPEYSHVSGNSCSALFGRTTADKSVRPNGRFCTEARMRAREAGTRMFG